MDKPIKDYLPKRIETTLVQAKVNREIVERVKILLEKKELTWSEIVTACLQKFLDEFERKRSK